MSTGSGDAAPVVFIDACVLFPPLVRAIVLGAARASLFVPCWSARVLEEWRIAIGRRHGPEAEDAVISARVEMEHDFPHACMVPDRDLELALDLPDPADVHVLAAAASADILLTFNLRDFPRRTLAGLGVEARHPDGFLWEMWSHAPDQMAEVIAAALASQGIDPADTRRALKRARLPRLGKALENYAP